MNPAQMIQDAEEAISQGQNMIMVVPRPFKNKPKGFPRGELLSEQATSNVKSYNPKMVLGWLKNNGLYDGDA